MEVKTVLSCPLGSKCEEIRDNALHRCAWLVHMAGTDPTTGEPKDEKGCAMSWMPILLVENSRQQVRTTSAVESFRNETAKSNAETRQILLVAGALQQRPVQLPAGPDHPLIGG